VFAFSCIMLNTSLHNPNVQFKPTLDQFIAMNSENENGSASHEIFEKTYNRCVRCA
jgi:Sec7-like guanine-nucleotide exchange factor